jgi:hypothetical protein
MDAAAERGFMNLSFFLSATLLGGQVTAALKAPTRAKAYEAWLSVTSSGFNIVQPFIKSAVKAVTFADIREDFEVAFRAIADRRGWK